jgi:superfamily II DNA or RNA helicase
MSVNTNSPLEIVYVLIENPYLGFVIEPYVVQLSANGELSLTFQKLNSKTAHDFSSSIDEKDRELIKLMEDFDMDAIAKKHHKKAIKTLDFFEKYFIGAVAKLIKANIELKMARALPLLETKKVFLKTKKTLDFSNPLGMAPNEAFIQFHFERDEEKMRYFPKVEYSGKVLDFVLKNAKVICTKPAWLLLNNIIYRFSDAVDGKKILPFTTKPFIEVPKTSEDAYFKKFVLPLIENYTVTAKGFTINKLKHAPEAVLHIETTWNRGNQILLYFKYGNYEFPFKQGKRVSANMAHKGNDYIFDVTHRSIEWEQQKAAELMSMQLQHADGAGFRIIAGKATAMVQLDIFSAEPAPTSKFNILDWVNEYSVQLLQRGFIVRQPQNAPKYLIAASTLNLEFKESNDWFDVHAIVKFGDVEVPFIKLRNHILTGKREFELPNGDIAVIPETWFEQLKDLFVFSDSHDELRLKKHHVGYVTALAKGDLAEVTMSRKLQNLLDFEDIEAAELPQHFKGELRPYQKSGYDWLCFLRKYNMGGCLADDMGLGKTVQTLALLQSEKEAFENNKDTESIATDMHNASLIIMPTSLMYNWWKEASRFAPQLRILIHAGTQRVKSADKLARYDLVLTSYGTARIDEDLFKKFYFNYIILDESQMIKNQGSQTSKTIKEFKSKHKLLLSGTPVENSITDLWSQLSFANPGLLGTFSYFKDEYVIPIEKQQDEVKTARLHALIKPFVMRRTKEQVAKELPAKVEQVHYCDMTEQQEEAYESVKSSFRNELLKSIDDGTAEKSSISILAGLMKLRQIANHPKMVEGLEDADSGKFAEVTRMVESAIAEGHKILVFSQFVKQLDIYQEHFDKEQIKYAYIDGSVNSKKRQELVDDFQENKDLKLFLISLKAGGVGLNLTAADYVFILDPWWNPAIENQAIDRAHRIGQQKTVFTYKFISKNTVEEKIVKLQEHKKALSDKLITTEESFFKSLSVADIKSILE